MNVLRALAVEVAINIVPDLKKNLEKEPSASGSRVEHEVVVVDVEHGHGETSQLAHRKVLTELATEDRAEEALEGHTNVIDIGACEADCLQSGDDLEYLSIWEVYPNAVKKN